MDNGFLQSTLCPQHFAPISSQFVHGWSLSKPSGQFCREQKSAVEQLKTCANWTQIPLQFFAGINPDKPGLQPLWLTTDI